ncbi:MAG: hypothetical protein J3K34DRAFT_447295 [Monoraphidium minutum]|nr:MAG: hypothetical protein J3K34DRAFT_447295 [Monoraphidium minutum]
MAPAMSKPANCWGDMARVLGGRLRQPFQDPRRVFVVQPLMVAKANNREEAKMLLRPPAGWARPGEDAAAARERWHAALSARCDVKVPPGRGREGRTLGLLDVILDGCSFYVNQAIWDTIRPLVTHLVILVYALEVDEEWLRRIVAAEGALVFDGICLCVRGRCIQTGKIFYTTWYAKEGLPTRGRNFSIRIISKKATDGVGTGDACVAPLFAALRARYGVLCHPKSQRHFDTRPFPAGWQASAKRGEAPFGAIQCGDMSLNPRISAQDIAFRAAVRAAERGASRAEAAAAVDAAGVPGGWVFDAMLSRMFDDAGAVRPVVAERLAQLEGGA